MGYDKYLIDIYIPRKHNITNNNKKKTDFKHTHSN